MGARRHDVGGTALALAAALSLALGLATGCDWRQFDDLKAHTPVLSTGAPSSFGATNDFGRYVLPLGEPASAATGGRYIGAAGGAAAVGVIGIDAQGNASGQSISADAFLTGAVNGESLPITSLAEVPGANQVLLGAPLAGDTGSVYVLTLGTNPDVTLLPAPPGAVGFGMGVAAAQLAGAATPDLVFVTANDIAVFVDGDPSKAAFATPPDATCPLAIGDDVPAVERNNRAVLVAPLAGAAPQIIVGTVASDGNAGAVSVFDVDANTGVATCRFAYRNSVAQFGHALAVGDFDGDHTPDLLIGAPPTGAFWVRGPLTATSPVLPVTLTGAGGGQLGASVAALDVDGQAGDEALVGDPAATVSGAALAGEVRIVGGATLANELPTLRNFNPGGADAFGASLGVLPFCTAGCGTSAAATRNLLLVGSQAHVFTYFVLEPGVPDPRKP
jgi:FG-GAP repeat